MSEERAGSQRTGPVETDFDHLDPAFAIVDDVHERLKVLRGRCPVAHTQADGGYFLAFRYPAIAEAARNASGAFSANVNIGAAPRVAPPLACIAPMFEVDGAEHRQWRKLLAHHFSQEAAATHEDHVRRLCRDAIARFVGDGQTDLVASYVRVIPPLVAAMVLGIPEQHRPALAEYLREFMTAATPDETARCSEAYTAFLSALLDDVEEESMIGTVARTSIGGVVPNPLQLTKFSALMLAAGHLTASDACAGVLLNLFERDRLRARVVAAEPGLLTAVINESVRQEPAVTVTGRAVVKETELGGVRLVPGDRVVLLWPSANRDESVFPDGSEFRVDREEPSAQQLAWGTGPHQCVGKHIARMEIRVMIEELLAAIPDVRLLPGARTRRTFGVIRGVPELPTIWSLP
ncbi:cytochrome P450 [Amycolatopsis rubida]|uniref:Cytochrome P450 n=1 Tax=Amycolatopsis rubida TaxID=112413 RepID=A0A1I5XCQ5_9PSEU|nr:cytochrome P450 [Amycolatopsis rubida]SFQ29636.1 Cytochrome P450 [Amycolatopsis rubida]